MGVIQHFNGFGLREYPSQCLFNSQLFPNLMMQDHEIRHWTDLFKILARLHYSHIAVTECLIRCLGDDKDQTVYVRKS